MKPFSLITQRLLNQHLQGPKFSTAADAVAHFGAVQGQDYLYSLWALGLRVEGATEAIIERALEEPMRRLAQSTGKHPPLIVEAARRRGASFGYDVLTEKVVDMRKAGISDPVKVVKAALTSAASATNMTMTTAALVLHKKPDTVMEP